MDSRNPSLLTLVLVATEMLLLDQNELTDGANHICGEKGPKPGPTIMSADCLSPAKLECTCCSHCCTDANTCYDDQNLVVNLDLELANLDLGFEQTFSVDRGYDRDEYVFSENIEFRPTHSSQVEHV
jgi:hypothetical protein